MHTMKCMNINQVSLHTLQFIFSYLTLNLTVTELKHTEQFIGNLTRHVTNTSFCE
jgi:hypothetical protein